MKLGRKYKLTIELEDGEAIEITDPLTCEFQIERNANASLNNATFKIFNLSKTNSNQLTQNRYTAARADGKRKAVVFQVGYGDLSIAFTGSILEAYPYRQGSNVITFINAQDGGFEAYTKFSNLTLSAGTTFLDAFKSLVGGLGLQLGAIGETTGSYKRGKALIGNNLQPPDSRLFLSRHRN